MFGGVADPLHTAEGDICKSMALHESQLSEHCSMHVDDSPPAARARGRAAAAVLHMDSSIAMSTDLNFC